MTHRVTKTLDLGCGTRPRNPFNADEVHGIDVRDDIPANIRSADLIVEPIPYGDDYFDFVTAHDFLEHVPRVIYVPQRRNAFVQLMNEVYRVLKPGGMFLASTPGYPHAPAFRDPTHVNIITEETFPLYFGDVTVREQYRWASMYGFTGSFRVTFQEWRGVHLLSVMRKVPVIEPRQQTADGATMGNGNLARAVELQLQGMITEAVPLFWDEHIADPGNGVPLYWLSLMALKNGNPAEAVRVSDHGVKVDPLFTPLRLVQGDALQALGRREEALQSYGKALDIYPDYLDALVNSALLLKQLSRHREALERFDQVIALDPSNAAALEHCRLLRAEPGATC